MVVIDSELSSLGPRTFHGSRQTFCDKSRTNKDLGPDKK